MPSKNGFVNRKYFYKQIVVSLQIKVYEVYIKPLKPREPVSIVESEGSDTEDNDEFKDLNISTLGKKC